MKQPLTNIQYAEALEAIAAFYRANPDMPQMTSPQKYFADRQEFLSAVKVLSSGGIVTKFADDPRTSEFASCYFRAKREFKGLALELRIDRSVVCRLVEPAKPAVYECPDSLLEEAAEFKERA